jgi:hypothetical protein
LADLKEEVLKFVKSNLKDLLQDNFQEKSYRDNKRALFYGVLRNQVGTPKDKEIATAALNYLFKLRHFKSLEQLEKVLDLPFFSKNIENPDYYIQKYQAGKNKVEIDLKVLGNEEYRAQLKEQLKQEILLEHSEEIDEEIRKKQAISNSIPSVLDNDPTYDEPREEVKVEVEENYLPWWKKLGLKADPFPTVDGLGNITENLYEEIIIKTNIYEKYVSYIRNSP